MVYLDQTRDLCVTHMGGTRRQSGARHSNYENRPQISESQKLNIVVLYSLPIMFPVVSDDEELLYCEEYKQTGNHTVTLEESKCLSSTHTQ